MTWVVRPASMSSVVILHVFSVTKLSKGSGSKPSCNEVCHPFVVETNCNDWLNYYLVLMSMMWIDSPSNSYGTSSILTLIVSWISPCGNSSWRSLWFLCVSSLSCISLFLHLFFKPHLLLSIWCHLSHHLNRDSRSVCSLSRVTDYILTLYNLYFCI